MCHSPVYRLDSHSLLTFISWWAFTNPFSQDSSLSSVTPESLALGPHYFLRETGGFGEYIIGCPWCLPKLTEDYRAALPTRSEWEFPSVTVWDKMCFVETTALCWLILSLFSAKIPSCFHTCCCEAKLLHLVEHVVSWTWGAHPQEEFSSADLEQEEEGSPGMCECGCETLFWSTVLTSFQTCTD